MPFLGPVAFVDAPEVPPELFTSFLMLFRTIPVMSFKAFVALFFILIRPLFMLNYLMRSASVDLMSSFPTRLPLSALRFRAWGGFPSVEAFA